jgi:hypothetical protein
VGSASIKEDNIAGTTITITNLQNGVSVYVWLKAVNEHGTSNFSAMSDGLPMAPTPTSPSAPDLTAGDALINVSWAAVTGATSYELWYNTDNDSSAATQFGGNITALSQIITGLTNDTTYYVWVKAQKRHRPHFIPQFSRISLLKLLKNVTVPVLSLFYPCFLVFYSSLPFKTPPSPISY